MRRFLYIIFFAFALFMLVAMVQEWQVFAAAWFGYEETESEDLSPADRVAVETAVRTFLAISSHYYGSQGDVRFLERLPAESRIAEELVADVEYLGRNGRFQTMRLQQATVGHPEVVRHGVVEVSTREYWIVSTRWLADGTEAEAVRSEVVNASYRLRREGSGWIVGAWRLDQREPIPADGGGER